MTPARSSFAARARVWATETAYRGMGAVTSLQVMPLLADRLRNERLPPHDLERLTWGRLQAILRYCRDRQPFYRRLWAEAGVDPTRFRGPEDLRDLPIVTKAALTAARLAGEFGRDGDGVQLLQTSGTTAGVPFAVHTSFDSYQKKYANHLRQFYTTGWRLGMRSAALHNAGHGQFRGKYSGEHGRREPWHRWRELGFAIAHHRTLLTPYHLAETGDEALIAEWERRLRRFSPYVLDTFYVNALMLGDWVERQGRVPLPVPALFVLGSLTPAERTRLGSIFDGEIFNRYSPHECEGIAVACSQHVGMHVAVDSYWVEILDERQAPLGPGEVGSVVVTDFENLAMPLVRYEIGDLAHHIAEPCPCGRTFPRISDLHGRRADILGTCRGRLVASWEAERLLQSHPRIRFFQIVRTDARISIRVVPRGDTPFGEPDVTTCTRQIEELFDPPLPVELVLVERLPFEPNGKYRFAKNARETTDGG